MIWLDIKAHKMFIYLSFCFSGVPCGFFLNHRFKDLHADKSLKRLHLLVLTDSGQVITRDKKYIVLYIVIYLLLNLLHLASLVCISLHILKENQMLEFSPSGMMFSQNILSSNVTALKVSFVL